MTDSRSNNAELKRAEQLKRWEQSDTYQEPSSLKRKKTRITFPDPCMFFAACSAGDKEEVRFFINNGVDINITNIDGLTALSQACISDNLEMVQFLLEMGADPNLSDNEGWCPLHATASCGHVSIARVLLESGADLAAVNHDGELPIDICETDQMTNLLQSEINARGIDCDVYRSLEEQQLLQDARQWLADGQVSERPNPKTGAVSLHVAAAKGYKQAISLLLKAGVNINAQDSDGWTPLHAAAYWGEHEACKLLCENLCNMNITNRQGQTAMDVADPSVDSLLERLRQKQLSADVDPVNSDNTSVPATDIDTNTDTGTGTDTGASDKQQQQHLPIDSSLAKVEEKPSVTNTTAANTAVVTTACTTTTTTTVSQPLSTSLAAVSPTAATAAATVATTTAVAAADVVAATTAAAATTATTVATTTTATTASPRRVAPEPEQSVSATVVLSPSTGADTGAVTLRSSVATASATITAQRRSVLALAREEESETRRRAHARRARESRRSTQGVTLEEIKSAEQYVKQQQQQTASATVVTSSSAAAAGASVSRDHSDPGRVVSASAADTTSVTGSSTATAASSAAAAAANAGVSMDRRPSWRLRWDKNDKNKFCLEEVRPLTSPVSATSSALCSAASSSAAAAAGAAGVCDNRDLSRRASLTPQSPAGQSDSSVTLQCPRRASASDTASDSDTGRWSGVNPSRWTVAERARRLVAREQGQFSTATATATFHTASPAISTTAGSNRSSGGAENAVDESGKTGDPARERGDTDGDRVSLYRSRDLHTNHVSETRPAAGHKDEDKENETRNQSQVASNVAIQKRRKAKRRSTGVVNFFIGEIEKDDKSNDADVATDQDHSSKTLNCCPSEELSATESSAACSRSGGVSRASTPADNTAHNGVVDYKKLYEEAMQENERLRVKLALAEEESREAKSQADRSTQMANARVAALECDKREHRTLDRKLAEMEEELKNLRTANQRLLDENGALIRVISKLSK